MGRHLIPIAVVFLAACSQEAPPPARFMLVASGPPECLGGTGGADDRQRIRRFENRRPSRAATAPSRFGPVDEPRLGAAIQAVKQTACASLDRVEKK